MIDLDPIVHDPRYKPHYGWFDDHGFSGGAKPAIQQHRSEFLTLAHVLETCGLNQRCLQLGLGHPGASHMVFSALFAEAWTLDSDRDLLVAFRRRIPEAKGLLAGSSQNKAIQQELAEHGPFDLVFIDADHSYPAAKADFHDYLPMVRPGGIIALHDTSQHVSHIETWRVVAELRREFEVHSIGSVLGISYVFAS